MVLTKSFQKVATGGTQTFGATTGYLEIWAKYNSQTIPNNTTNYTAELRLIVPSGYYIGNYQSAPYSLSATGIGTGTGDNGSGNYTSQTLKTITGNVTHNSDGKKDVSISGSITFSAWGKTLTVSGSATLPTIPRTSGVACSSPYIGDTATITIDRKSSAFTDTISYKIGEITGTIAEKTSNTVLSLDTSSIADEIYALIPNATETTGEITCTTYSGDTQIGTSKANFNLYAKESVCKPNVSGTVVDTNETAINLTGSSNKFIKYVSKPKVSITATPNKSATIKSYSINLNDGQTSNSQEYTFEKIGSNNVTINAIDSRGYGNPQNIDLSENMIDYVELHINKIDLRRTEEASNEIILNLDGVWFNGNFNDTTANQLTASFKYKTSDAKEWVEGGSLTPTIENNTFKITNLSLGTTFDYQKEYQFKVILSDLLETVGNSNSDIQVVAKGQEVVAIGENGVLVYGYLLLNDVNILDKIPNLKSEYSTEENSTYSCNYFNQIFDYSTEERVVGRWIDGKLLYEKTIETTCPSASATWKTITDGLNAERIINYTGYVEFSSTEDKILANGTGQFTYFQLHKTKHELQVATHDTGFFNKPLIVAIRYTKTTD